MKKTVKLYGLIVLLIISGFLLSACPNLINQLTALDGSVSINGIAQVGQTLTVNLSALRGSGLIFYQWVRNNNDIIGNESTYVVQTADVGSRIRVIVNRSDNTGTITSLWTPTVIDLPPLTGTVSINGNFQTGEILTADTENLEGSGAISYLWKRDEVIEIGINNNTYLLQNDDTGSAITVTVTRTNNSGSVTSAPTVIITDPGLPALTGNVVLSNHSPKVTDTIIATYAPGNGSGIFAWQWLRDDAVISGANSNTYTVVLDDLDCKLSARVSYINQSGNVTSDLTIPVTRHALGGAVIINNTTPKVADTLTAVYYPGNGSGTVIWQWLRNDVVISGADSNTYTVAAADYNTVLKAIISYAEQSGSIASSPTAVVGYPELTGTVSINGTAQVGQTLSANTSNLQGSGTISYQWNRGGNVVGTSSTYIVQRGDLNSTITLTVTRAENSGSIMSGATEVVIYPPLTGTVSIDGTAQVGQTLTAVTTGLGGNGTISYQWKRSGNNITGATNSTYILQNADLGSVITLTVTRAENSGSVISDATEAVIYPPLTGTMSIDGTAQVGQTLTADTTSLGGSGTISYQWKRDGTTNIGTNSNSYTLQEEDIGSTITVTVTRSENTGSVTSDATGVVAEPTIPALTGTVSISGSEWVGETLTADTTNLGGSGTISYQWKRDGSTNIGTNSNSYTLQEADIGSTITVTVTRSGNSGSVTSEPTGVVAIPSYTITFNLNGGTGTAPTQQTISAGGSIPTLPPGTGFSGTGYQSKFDGWTTVRNNPSTKVTSFTPTENSTLYANWIPYELRDTGPAGGIIFYVDPTGFTVQGYSEGSGETAYLNFTEYTAYYLEAALTNSGSIEWANNWNDLIPGLSQDRDDETDWAIGRGRMNTSIIIARGISQSYTTPAALACRNYFVSGYNTFNDWFLPSRDELNQLYVRRFYFGLSSGWFWSSTQLDSGYAREQSFGSGGGSDKFKSTSTNVRSIRAF